jgi:hypothetical protein
LKAPRPSSRSVTRNGSISSIFAEPNSPGLNSELILCARLPSDIRGWRVAGNYNRNEEVRRIIGELKCRPLR